MKESDFHKIKNGFYRQEQMKNKKKKIFSTK